MFHRCIRPSTNIESYSLNRAKYINTLLSHSPKLRTPLAECTLCSLCNHVKWTSLQNYALVKASVAPSFSSNSPSVSQRTLLLTRQGPRNATDYFSRRGVTFAASINVIQATGRRARVHLYSVTHEAKEPALQRWKKSSVGRSHLKRTWTKVHGGERLSAPRDPIKRDILLTVFFFNTRASPPSLSTLGNSTCSYVNGST